MTQEFVDQSVEVLTELGFEDKTGEQSLNWIYFRKDIGCVELVAFCRSYFTGMSLYIDGGERENSFHLPEAKNITDLRAILAKAEEFLSFLVQFKKPE